MTYNLVSLAVLLVLAVGIAVTFRSCDKESYKAIVAERSYLVAKNQEQLSSSLSYVCVGLLVWGLLVALGFLAAGRGSGEGR